MKKVLAAFIALIVLLVILVVSVLGGGDECTPNGTAGGSSVGDGDFAYPTDLSTTRHTSPFGPRINPVTGADEGHGGLDIAGPEGTPIYAFADGVVVAAADHGVQGFGGWVVIDHTIEGKQIQTVYGHMNPGGVFVTTGDHVTKGQHIANMGNSGQSTGAHLHFEVIEGDRARGGRKVDPKPWLDKAAEGTGAHDTGKTSEAAASSGLGQPADAGGGANIGGEQLTGRQLALAKQIVAVGEALGVDEQGRIIAVATAKHESQLQVYANDGSGAYQSAGASGATPEELRTSLNYPHDAVGHDHASVGTFQQQVGFWGSVEELMNPAVQARKFYEALSKIDYHGLSVGAAASKVQGNATGTGVYEREAEKARLLVERFAGAGEELSPEEIEALGSASIGAGSSGCSTTGSHSGGGDVDAGELNEAILEAARKEFGYPYVWGGGDQNGPTGGGYDCSGLVLRAVAVASNNAIILPHYTGAQIVDPNLHEIPWDERAPGDLIYLFDGANPHHVAIYAGENNGQETWYEAQTYGVKTGEYPIRTTEPHRVYRVGQKVAAADDGKEHNKDKE